MSHHGRELYQGDYHELITLVERELSAFKSNSDTFDEFDQEYCRRLKDLRLILRDYTTPRQFGIIHLVDVTLQEYRECLDAVEKHEPFGNLPALSWNFEFYKEVISILFEAYSKAVKENGEACQMLPMGWQDILKVVDEQAWMAFTVGNKRRLFEYVKKVVDLIGDWPEQRTAPAEAFMKLAELVDWVTHRARKGSKSSRELSGVRLSEAISNLVNATRLTHNELSKEVEAGAAPDSRLANLHVQMQELDVMSLILKHQQEGGAHLGGVVRRHHLTLTQAEYVQCLTRLLRVPHIELDDQVDLVLACESPLLDFVWVRCPDFEVFAFEKEMFLKSRPSGSVLERPLKAVGEEEWNNTRVTRNLRTAIISALNQDRVAYQESLSTDYYPKKFRDDLLHELTELHRVVGPQRNKPFVARARLAALEERVAQEHKGQTRFRRN